ncbi:MAG: hypothetical protein ACPF9D_12035, partial [Owenweeksia sp.]
MRQNILYLIFILFGLTPSYASHLLGGEITATIDSAGNGIVTLKLYRDGGPTSAILQPHYSLASNSGNFTVNRIKTDTISTSPIIIERHIYESSLIQGLANIPMQSISFSECCRTPKISNINNPGGTSITLVTSINYNNSSSPISLPSVTPVFLGSPMVKFPKDTLWTYNPTAYDGDGDSLYFELAGANTISGYNVPPANPGGSLSIDPFTGEISWNASQTGYYVIGFSVEEWRDNNSVWVKAGEVYREMVIIVVSDTSQLRVLPPLNVTATSGVLTASFTGDSTSEIIFPFYSLDTNAILNMSAFGAPFEFDNSDAAFTVTKYKKNNDTLAGVFSWTPQAARKNQGPYLLTFRATDGSFSKDYTVLIEVNSVIGIEEIRIDQGDYFSIYPNPGNGSFNLHVNEMYGEGSLKISVFD